MTVGMVLLMGELNLKQKKFADYYIETGNAKVLEYIIERNE
jgi:hypothetical protein